MKKNKLDSERIFISCGALFLLFLIFAVISNLVGMI